MMKSLSELEIKGNFLNLTKNVYKTPTADITLGDEKLEAFPLRSGPMQDGPSPYLSSTILESPLIQ